MILSKARNPTTDAYKFPDNISHISNVKGGCKVIQMIFVVLPRVFYTLGSASRDFSYRMSSKSGESTSTWAAKRYNAIYETRKIRFMH